MVSVARELIKCWAELQFAGGVVVVGTTSEQREGLRLLDGVHPRAGARYRVAIVEPAAPERKVPARMEAKTTTLVVAVLANDSDALRTRFVPGDQPQVTVDVTLEHPAGPRALSFVLGGRLTGNWMTRGPIAGEGHISVDGLPPAKRSGPQVRAQFRHPRIRAAVTVWVEDDRRGLWRVAVEVRARGSGILRPLAAAVAPWLAAAVRRQLRASMAGLPERVDSFNQDWRTQISQIGAAGVAQRWVDDFLSALPASVPEGERREAGSSKIRRPRQR